MKNILKLAIAFMALFSFAACSDVPMPYEEPGTGEKTDSTTTDVTAKGSGTATDPYNVTAALNVINALSSNDSTKVIYVKGAVKEIKQIETEKYGNANYYITDNGSNELYIFQSYYLGNRKFTASDALNVGDTVVVCGRFYKYQGSTPETVGKGTSYIYSLNGKTSGDTPVTPSTGVAKGSGTEADPYNATAANKAASALGAYEKKGDPTLENVYISGIISKVGTFTEKFGEITYYLSDDGTESSDQFCVYGGYGKDGAKFTSASDLKVGQKVTVVGTLMNFKGNTPEFQYGSKIVSIEGSGSSTGGSTGGSTTTSDDVTVKAGDFGLANSADMGTQTLSDGTILTFDKGSNSNAPKYYSTGSGTIRMYPGNSVAVNAGSKKIASITIVCDSYNGTDYTAEGKLTSTQGTVSLSSLTYTISSINASTFTLTNGDTGTGGKTQLRILSIAITYAK
jgi:hypothetical protein